MKTLILADNTYFLDWVYNYPFKTKIINSTKSGSIEKGVNLLTFSHKIRLLSYLHDIVFCEFFTKWASKASHASSKPIFIRLHRYEIHDPTDIKTADLDNIASIIAVSKYYKELIEEYFKGDVPVTVIPNAIDTSKFSFSEKTNTPLKLCTLSSLTPRKRVFDLITNNPKLEINIGGRGIEQTILERTISRLNLKAQLHGFVELPQFYHQHDVFIQNSSDESFGVSLIEAMSCGLIPLCYAWGGIEEILPKYHIYHNYDELKEKISSLSNMSPKEILRVKKDMRVLVERKYNVEDQTKRFIDLFREFTGSERSV